MYPAQNNCWPASPEIVGGAPEYYPEEWKKDDRGMTAHMPTLGTNILTNPAGICYTATYSRDLEMAAHGTPTGDPARAHTQTPGTRSTTPESGVKYQASPAQMRQLALQY